LHQQYPDGGEVVKMLWGQIGLDLPARIGRDLSAHH
jgi:TPP-dependent 2-oxoacid decarboxylase